MSNQLRNNLLRIVADLQTTADSLAREGDIAMWRKCQEAITYTLAQIERLEVLDARLVQLQGRK